MKKSKKSKNPINREISVQSVSGQPVDTFDMLRKYGTYEIQPTSDNENEFPQISSGLPRLTGAEPVTPDK